MRHTDVMFLMLTLISIPPEIIYVLQLEEGKFYVGKTRELERRLQQHRNKEESKGAAWTRKFPLLLDNPWKSFEATRPSQEDEETKALMWEFGVDNVRGGTYSEVELREEFLYTIEHERRTSLDLCYICRDPSHFIRNCPTLNQAHSVGIPSRVFEEPCSPCGRASHPRRTCHSIVHRNGEPLSSVDSDEE